MGDDLPDLDGRVEVVPGIDVFGAYRSGALVVGAPHDHRQGAVAFHTRQLVLATGRRSLPPLVPGAHLPGVMDAHTALDLAHTHGIRLGEAAAVVGTGVETVVAARLQASGTPVAYCGSVRDLRRVEGRTHVSAVHTDRRVRCDVLVHCGPWAADPGLVSQACDTGLLHLRRGPLPANVVLVGAAARPDEPPVLWPESDRDALVCPCMDVTAGELMDRIAQGDSDPEVLKRATSCGMGPCQGMPCWSLMSALIDSCLGGERAGDEVSARRPSFRGPRRAITVAQAAGLAELVEPDR